MWVKVWCVYIYFFSWKGTEKGKSHYLNNTFKGQITVCKWKNLYIWRCDLCSDETEIEMFGYNDFCDIWRKKGESLPAWKQLKSQLWQTRVTPSHYMSVSIQQRLVHFIKCWPRNKRRLWWDIGANSQHICLKVFFSADRSFKCTVT